MSSDRDSVLIEILDGDPNAFADATTAAPAERPEWPGWVRPAAIAVAVVVAAAAVLVWCPWHHEPEPPLSNRLVLHRPTSAVLDVALDRIRPPDVSGTVGYVFAEEGATISWVRTGSGRWLTWTAYPADSANAAYAFGDDWRAVADVQGTPAEVSGDTGLLRLVFGPIGGRVFDVGSSGLTLEEVTSVAGAIGVEGGRPVLRGGHDALFELLGLRPVGTTDELDAAVALLSGDPLFSTAATTSVRYVDDGGHPVGIASVADPGDGPLLAMLRLLLGPSGTATVHGRDAIATDVRLQFRSDGSTDTLVAWHEGGRLIVVTGSTDLSTLVALADGAHEATEEQWAPVAAQAVDDADQYGYWSPTIGYRRATSATTGRVTEITEITASSARLGSVDVCLDDQFAGNTDCVTDADMRLPYLNVLRIHTAALIVAIVAAGSGESLLRVTHDDGSVDEHLLFAPGRQLPGPAVAVFLPDDLREAALVVDGEVVATL